MKLSITKKIAKQGDNLVLIIPKSLHAVLAHGDLIQVDLRKISNKSEDER